MASSDLQWQLLRKSSCFLRKQRGIRKTFTREPLNLKGVNSFRYNGIIKRKAVGLEAGKSGKGIVLMYKKSRGQNKPVSALNKVSLPKDARRTLGTIKNFMKKQHYCTSLNKLALRRASQILKSQKQSAVKKTRRTSRKKKSD